MTRLNSLLSNLINGNESASPMLEPVPHKVHYQGDVYQISDDNDVIGLSVVAVSPVPGLQLEPKNHSEYPRKHQAQKIVTNVNRNELLCSHQFNLRQESQGFGKVTKSNCEQVKLELIVLFPH